MYSKELIKGFLSAIILKLLYNNKMHGYLIMQRIAELSNNKIILKDGSLYPALHKLKEEKLVQTETEYIGLRIRHHYYLTEKGKKVAEEKIAELKDFMETLNKIISNE